MGSSKASSNINDLFRSKDLIFTSFREMGLFVFDRESVHLVSVVPSTSDGLSPTYNKITTINFANKLPGQKDVCELIPSENGKFLALVSVRLVFLLELPRDFWDFQSIISSQTLNHFRPDYTVDLNLINPNLQLMSKSLFTEKAVWLTSCQSRYPHTVLGILSSDNKLRVYQVSKSKAQPVAIVDFGILISDSLDETSYDNVGKGYGLIKKMVSFDFGPEIQNIDDEKEPFSQSVLALDSEGDVYHAEFHLNFQSQIIPQGPLTLSGITKSNFSFYTNIEDVVYINHGLDQSINVFAFASDKGEVFHALLAPSAKTESFEPKYQLCVIESVLIEDWQTNNSCVYLRRDPNRLAQFIIINEKQVFNVDLSDNLYTLVSSGGEHHAPVLIRSIFLSISPDGTYISSISQLIVETTNRCMVLLAVQTSDDSFWANLIHQATKKPEFRTEVSHQRRSQTDGGFSMVVSNERAKNTGVPQISIKGKQGKDLEDSAIEAIGKLNAYMKKQRDLSDFINGHAKTKQVELLNLGEQKKAAHDRLFVIFNKIRENKQKLAQFRKELNELDKRFSNIIDVIEDRSYNLTDDEVARTSLESIQGQINEDKLELRTAAGILLSVRGKFTKATRPFQASASAQIFMLSKNTVEIAELENQLQNVGRELQEAQ